MDAHLLMYGGRGVFYLCCHRGWWKTSFAYRRIFEKYLSKGVDVSWCASTFKPILNAIEDVFKKSLGEEVVKEWLNSKSFTFRFPGMGNIFFYSLQEASNMAGPSTPVIVIDESGDVDEGDRDSVIYPIARKGYVSHGFSEIINIGTWNRTTPQNEFYQRLKRHEQGTSHGKGWIIPVQGDIDGMGQYIEKESPLSNPHYTYELVKEDYENSEDKARWQVEWLCRAISLEGNQFENIERSTVIEPLYRVDKLSEYYVHPTHTYNPKGNYQIGIDIGKNHDPLVASVVDTLSMEQVFFRRFLPGTWENVYASIRDVMTRFPGRTVVDTTGGGDHVPEYMEGEGFPVDGFKFTVSSKTPLLDSLSSFISRGGLKIFNLPLIVEELSYMNRTARKAGGFTIEGAKGRHDDIPVSLALMVFQLPLRVQSEQTVRKEPQIEVYNRIPSYKRRSSFHDL
jgi:hypothetical protein